MKLNTYQSAALGVLMFNVVYILIMYSGLPDIIPNHFDYQGKADGHGAKSFLIIGPIIGSFIFFVMYYAQSTEKYNLPKSVSPQAAKKSIGQLTLTVQIVFLLVTYSSITTALSKNNPIEGWMAPLIIILIFLPVLGMFVKKQ